MKNKFSRKWLWLLVLLAPMALADSGYCYRETRWPDKSELIDRALFGQKFYNQPVNFTHEEKIKFSKEYYSSSYPEFCTINNNLYDLGGGEAFINFLLGRKLYEVECVYPLNENDPTATATEKYYIEFSSVNACATKVIDTSGFSITEKEYKFYLRKYHLSHTGAD